MDETVYQSIYNVITDVLNRNVQQLGQEFCRSFAAEYNPRNGQTGYNNAQFLLNTVTQQAQRLNGNSIVQPDQLFQIVGGFIQETFNQYANQVRQRQNMGQGSGFNTGGFGSSGGFGSGFGRSSSPGFNTQPGRQGPGSHLADDTANQTAPTPQAQSASAPAPITLDKTKPETASVVYKANPLDELEDSSADFASVKNKPIWGDEKAKDNRIVITQRYDLKSHRFIINRFGALHQLILDDPMTVVKDFFDIVPDQTLGTPFLFKILYNHLDTLEVPTEAFVAIRKSCIDTVIQAQERKESIVLHKQIGKILESLPTGQWKALTGYLVYHINRALYLNARLTANIKGSIKISTFDDVNDLLSSSFNHPLTTYPDGRRILEAIVGGVLWNVLVANTSIMFNENTVPTHALQSSPAFPFSIDQVYPNKFSIPMDNEENAQQFMTNLKEHELNQRTYLLSRRSVVITNGLGKTILPFITKDATIINNPLAQVLNQCSVDYGSISPDPHDTNDVIEPFVSEGYPSQELENYYSNPNDYVIEDQSRLTRIAPTKHPIDQTVFAVQFGMDPKDYLMAFDIFTTIDNSLGKAQMILAKKQVSSIKTTV